MAANTPATSDTPPATSGISGGIRITIAVFVAIVLGIFMLTWDANFLVHHMIPNWLGPYVFMPLIALTLGYGSNCLIQQLSCGQVQWLVQLQRIAIIPVPIILMWFILYLAPGLRWPIEGLMQSGSPELKKGLSSGFYAFWIGLYGQLIMNGAAQLCPK
jgi:hypothetical protein